MRKILAVLSFAAIAACVSAQTPVVHTASGSLAGVKSPQSSVVSFKGIPFAAPPVGDLRWAPPAPAAPWTGTRQADTFGASCMQHERDEFLPWTHAYLAHNEVSEDCLFLNIWTPRVSPSANLPVVVYIHGGGFTEGSGGVEIYDGEHLAQTGLVLVTINYRLGIFGFFAHPDLTAESAHHTSGNYALLDQIAALAWVKSNIRAFGGDPTRVTIWGQSAGAFSVNDLLASPLAAGLFQRAMADSGIGLASLPMQTLQAAEQSGTQFAAARHASSLKDLRAIPAADLLNATGPRFGPIVDGYVLPASPSDPSAAGNDVPVITGYQANDGALFGAPPKTVADYQSLVMRQYGDLAPDFEKLYPAATPAQARDMITQSIRDRDRVSMYLWASRRAASHHQPVFTYFFTRAIPWPQHPEFGAFHSGELPYFFLNQDHLDRPWQLADGILAKASATYLKNFATTGNPNGSGVPNWPNVSASTPQTMELGEKIAPMPLAEKDRLDFWIKFFNSPAGAHAPPF
ncbi:MAG TPA: carboxylesterase family protein [Terracidiphilus sp.]|nr:carboxylesterase family protein [Terracidiphilus sp.]